jgi:hypothetical protein
MRENDIVTCTGTEYDELLDCKNELARAHREAANLAMFLWNKFYKDDSPNFELLKDPAGILTQIDNMLSGLKMERDA